MRIAAIIPNWNGAHLLDRLLPTIAAQTRQFDSVVMVDNGSSDGSVEIATRFGAQIIRLHENRGFAPAVNRGVQDTSADAIAILNNDVELDRQWLQIAENTLLATPSAFVTGKILSLGNETIVDGAFDAICRGGCALRCGSGKADQPYWSVPRTIHFAPMTAVVFRTRTFNDLGGLDEAFESYLEDVEFGLRCASNGYSGAYIPTMVARHRGSATLGAWSSRSVRNISRNQILLLARHYDTQTLWRFGWAIAVAQALWGLSAIRHGRAAAWITGKVDGLRQFRSVRRTGSVQLPAILRASERLIAEVQRETGYDAFWRLYFALTRGPESDGDVLQSRSKS